MSYGPFFKYIYSNVIILDFECFNIEAINQISQKKCVQIKNESFYNKIFGHRSRKPPSERSHMNLSK